MPKFLTAPEIYRILQRELPEAVYPDGAPVAFYSTAENFAVASVAATGYANLERIYDNQWPQTADERMTDWEITAFGKPLPASMSLPERRDRTAQKIRSRKGLTKQDMIDIVLSVIGTDKTVDAIEWGCSGNGSGGAWIIGVSLLGVDTYLGGSASIQQAVGPMLCEQSPADFGLTQQQWDDIRAQAYTYEILVYGYTLTDEEFNEVDQQLSTYEPARCRHFIRDGLDPAFIIDGGFADSVYQFEIDGGEGADTPYDAEIDGGDVYNG